MLLYVTLLYPKCTYKAFLQFPRENQAKTISRKEQYKLGCAFPTEVPREMACHSGFALSGNYNQYLIKSQLIGILFLRDITEQEAVLNAIPTLGEKLLKYLE